MGNLLPEFNYLSSPIKGEGRLSPKHFFFSQFIWQRSFQARKEKSVREPLGEIPLNTQCSLYGHLQGKVKKKRRGRKEESEREGEKETNSTILELEDRSFSSIVQNKRLNKKILSVPMRCQTEIFPLVFLIPKGSLIHNPSGKHAWCIIFFNSLAEASMTSLQFLTETPEQQGHASIYS